MSAPTDAGGGIGSNIGGRVTEALHQPGTAGPPPRQWAGGGGKVTVNRDNVLQVAKLFQDAAEQMRNRVDIRIAQMRTAPAMGDPVSQDMAAVMNHRFVGDQPESYASRARQFADGLADTAEELTRTARDYGYTEEDIATALQGPAAIQLPSTGVGDRYAAGWLTVGGGPWRA
jgi:hypothetical protein